MMKGFSEIMNDTDQQRRISIIHEEFRWITKDFDEAMIEFNEWWNDYWNQWMMKNLDEKWLNSMKWWRNPTNIPWIMKDFNESPTISHE
jgi:hypothetical protein